MPFLGIEEYPRIVMYIESGHLKIHLQGWMNTCEGCLLLGGMWVGKKDKKFYDFYLCKKNFESEGKEYFKIKYGDAPAQRYLKETIKDCKYSIKWRAIKGLYRRKDELLFINPIEFIELRKE